MVQPEHIPNFKALLETNDPHQKADSVHAKIQTQSTPEHIPIFRALLEIKIEMEIEIELWTTSSFLGLYSR